METTLNGVTLQIIRGDITEEEVDAIVNAANSRLAGGGGVDGAIHMAGGPAIMEECRRIGYCPTGDAVVTGAGRLKARYVIHTVGPVWRGGYKGEKELLAMAYKSCMKRARELKIKSMAFPAVSAGAYGFPLEEAASIAIGTVASELEKDSGDLSTVRFVLFNQDTYSAFKATLENRHRNHDK